MIVAELRLIKRRPTSFYKKHNLLQETMLKVQMAGKTLCLTLLIYSLISMQNIKGEYIIHSQ